MARYEITANGSKYEITVPDEWSQDQVSKLVTEKFAPEQDKPGTAYDVGKSLASGYLKGTAGLVGLPGTIEQLGRMGINAVAGEGTVSPEPALPNYNRVKAGIERLGGGKLYEPQTTMGKYGQTAAEFASGALAIPGAGGVGRRLIENAVLPGLASEAAGQATEGTSLEPWARVGGALAGGMLPGMAARAISPNQIAAPRQAAVQTLRNEGVTDLTAGQVTGSKTLRWAESNAIDTPLSGGKAQTMLQNQQEQFTRAALRRAGISANRATPDVLDDAFSKIGAEFNRISAKAYIDPSLFTPRRHAQLMGQAKAMLDDYKLLPDAQQSSKVVDMMEDVITRLQNKTPMDGRTYQTTVQGLGRQAASAPAEVARPLMAIKELYDDMIKHSLRQADRDAFQTARRQYRNLVAISKAATAGGENAASGLLSPAQLRTAIASGKWDKRAYARGQGDLAALTRAGNEIMLPLPQSGTAPRALMNTVGAGLGGTVMGAPGAIGGALAPVIGQGMFGRAVMSSPVQNYLMNQAATPAGNALRYQGSIAARAPGIVVQGMDEADRDKIRAELARRMLK